MLVEFASAGDAVECALEVQQANGTAQCRVSKDRRILFRIGINLGDIVVDGDDIFGDGVNIAARLQEHALPGGVSVSQAVHDQIAHKLDVKFADTGEQPLKNISRPMRVYRLILDGVDTGSAAAQSASHSGTAEHLSVAVLPFANMSGEPDQDFFSDGLTEDIITELSRFRDLLVISRNSTFVYKGRAINVQEVARAFGVHYVVEGSVRKSGNRVRITVQLIDAKSDRHVWAERYDRELSDIFAVQDEVVSAIVGTLPGRVEAAAHERAQRNPTKDMRAYEYVLAAKVLHHRSRREDNVEAQRLIEKAIELDPKYAHAHAWRGCIVGQAWIYNWCDDLDTAKQIVISRAQPCAIARRQ